MLEKDLNYGTSVEDFENMIVEDSDSDREEIRESGTVDSGNGDVEETTSETEEEEKTTAEEDGGAGEDVDLTGEEPKGKTKKESSGDEASEKALKTEDGMLVLDENARINVDGQPVLFKELASMVKKDSEWKKANTLKTEAIAKERKALEVEKLATDRYRGVVDLLKNNPEILDTVKSSLAGNEEAIKLIDGAMEVDPVALSSPYKAKIEELQNEIERRDQEAAFNAQRNDAKIKHDLSSEDLKEIDSLLIQKFKDSRIALNYEEGFRLWTANQILESRAKARKKPPEIGKEKNKATGDIVRSKKKEKGYDPNYGIVESDFKDAFLK